MMRHPSHVGKVHKVQTWISPFEVIKMEKVVDKMKLDIKVRAMQTDKQNPAENPTKVTKREITPHQMHGHDHKNLDLRQNQASRKVVITTEAMTSPIPPSFFAGTNVNIQNEITTQ